MAWNIEYDPGALQDLKKLDRQIQREIIDYMDNRVATARTPRDFVLYYGDARRTFVLLHAFEKRSQAVPEAELRAAMNRMVKDQDRKGRRP